MSDTQRRGPIVRALVGIWDGMNFVRRLVFNLVFFGLLLLLLIALTGGRGGIAPLGERTTLVIAPQAELVEQYRTDPVTRSLGESLGKGAPEVQLRDLLRALEAARDDADIERVLLRVDRMAFSGYASIREVSGALAELRAAGKQIVAYGDWFTQPQYLLAAQADEVYIDPEGGVLLDGLSSYRQYFREGVQDKLGVDVHLFKVGEYKSAAEPYILDAASAESKEADLYWMNDIWQRYLGDIARLRGIDPAVLAAGVDGVADGVEAAQGDLARYALQQKLVDGLKTPEEIEALLTERGAADADAPGGFRQASLADYLKQLDLRAPAVDPRPQVAVVVAEGTILDGTQPPGSVGGESTAALLREARDDDDVRALVLRVDSPGGGVFASEQIRREIVGLKQAGKPVVVSFGDVAASGGYWISMDADRIYADESTITGSIGIFALVPTFQRSLEKIGVRTDGVGTTPLAGAFDVSRGMSPDTARIIQSVIEKGYRDFTGKVAQGRGRPVEEIDAVARGRVWSGRQARDRGLVDEFGGLRAAIADAAARAELGDAGDWRVRYVERAGTPFENWFSSFVQGRLGQAWLRDSDLATALLSRAMPRAAQELHFVDGLLQSQQGRPAKAVAHCFCGL